MMERTFVMIKPDGVQRGLIGRVISRIEDKGLLISALKMIWLDRKTAERHYEMHRDKPFFSDLIHYITSGPCVAMVVCGPRSVEIMRRMVGPTDAGTAEPGTIRGDFALDIRRNLVHASDSPESAEREIAIFFSDEDIYEYVR